VPPQEFADGEHEKPSAVFEIKESNNVVITTVVFEINENTTC
jgi:hypothetical protein